MPSIESCYKMLCSLSQAVCVAIPREFIQYGTEPLLFLGSIVFAALNVRFQDMAHSTSCSENQRGNLWLVMRSGVIFDVFEDIWNPKVVMFLFHKFSYVES